jgi:CheY-like chemotaxis protein
LVDLYLPELDCDINPIQQIRSNPTWQDIPTPEESEADRERYLTAGATECLSKPLKLKQLMTTIEQLLASKLKFGV